MKSKVIADISEQNQFDEIVDVRTPAEFAIDHIPGAINLPVLSDEERAIVGTLNVQKSPFEANKVGSALRENLPVFAQYLHGQRFHIMNQQQSLEFIRLHPALVGADPILIVLDRESCEQKNPGGFGFRMCLGHLQNPDAAISMLKWAVQLSMAANSTQMAMMVKQSAHRQTIQGTIELMSGAHNHHLEFAPV